MTKPPVMGLNRRTVLAAATAAALARPARAQAPAIQAPIIRIGVLTDLSGPYRDTGGQTSIACARQAIEDFNGGARGINAEVIAIDHQQKPDIANSIVREWFDRGGVDAVVDVNNSAIAFAVTDLANAADKVHLNTGAFSADITGPRCSPNQIHWGSDTWQIAKTMTTAEIAAGHDKWFLLVADYAFGAAMQRDMTSFIAEAGAKVMGAVRYPFPGTSDFSSYLLQAQSSGANVIAFANAAGDFVNSIKQSHEFGLTSQGMTLAGLVVFVTDIHALGLETAQGLRLTEGFYWDQNDRTRGFAKRILARTPTNMPNASHASTYAAVTHYLKAVESLGVAQAKASGRATVAAMKRLPTDDDCFGAGQVREDGQHLHPVFLFEAKKPAQSKSAWDLYNTLATIPPEVAWRPLSQGKCPMIKA